MYRLISSVIIIAVVIIMSVTATDAREMMHIVTITDHSSDGTAMASYDGHPAIPVYIECNDTESVHGAYPLFDVIIRAEVIISAHFTTDNDVTCMIESDYVHTASVLLISYNDGLAIVTDSTTRYAINAVAEDMIGSTDVLYFTTSHAFWYSGEYSQPLSAPYTPYHTTHMPLVLAP